MDENKEVDYEVKENNINKPSSNCIIMSIINGKLVHYSNKVFHSLQ